MNRLTSLLLCFTFIVATFQTSLAQNGVVTGAVLDAATSDALIGATVYVESNQGLGTVTDIDGIYELSLKSGSYSLVFQFLSYQSKVIEGVEVKANEVVTLNVTMESNATQLQDVVVRASLVQENINTLMTQQKNSTVVQDGISADLIRRTPDKNTAEAMKRVSGVSLSENKFAIIRGLSDRYNSAAVNGISLPSTEADRKNFTFDLIPSSLVDNIIIIKTAQPDMPGDFAGGIITVNTRDIPESNFLNLSVSTGINTISTFRPKAQYQGGDLDWLGVDDGTRALPADFPSTETLQNSDEAQTIEHTLLLPNDWATYTKDAMRPKFAGQVSGGLNKGKFGGVVSLTYDNTPRFNQVTRQDFNFSDTTALYRYYDSVYTDAVLMGALLNVGYKFSPTGKIAFKNSYTINSTNSFTVRGGSNLEQQFDVRNFAYDFVSNQLLNSQLSGENLWPKSKLKLDWNVGFARVSRSQPDFRKLYYNRTLGDTSSPFLAFIPVGSASPNLAGKFYSDLYENTWTGGINASYGFEFLKNKSTVKTGLFYQNRAREFDARVLGYTITNVTAFYTQNEDPNAILASAPGDLFVPEHIGTAGFSIDEITNPSDHYTGSSDLTAVYAMMDNALPAHFRIIWGARFEFFHQTLSSFDYTNNPVEVDTRSSDFNKLPFDFLPSVNLIYALNDKSNLRGSFSKTIARPEFRELAPFSFYDFTTTSVVIGNDSLQRTNIFNYDLRYEYFFGGGQMISGSVFYKKFNEPIEQTIDFISSGGYIRSYENVTSAANIGVELDYRKNFDFLKGLSKEFSNLTFNTNLAFISSKVDVSEIANAADSTRSLQGQSPYIINMGLSYFEPKSEFSATVMFNEIGRRIVAVGSSEYLDIYEAPRPILDIQLSKRIAKKGSLRLNFQDILARNGIFYQDANNDGKFRKEDDKQIVSVKTGVVITLGFSYKF
jgi:TonB-dependent receptor